MMTEQAAQRGPLIGWIGRHRPPDIIQQSADTGWSFAGPSGNDDAVLGEPSLHALLEKLRRFKKGFETAAHDVQRAVRHERRAREQPQDQIIAEPVEGAGRVEAPRAPRHVSYQSNPELAPAGPLNLLVRWRAFSPCRALTHARGSAGCDEALSMRDARRRRRFPPARPATRKPPTHPESRQRVLRAVATGCALLGCLAHCGILSLSRTDGGVSLALRASNITATSALLIVSVVAAGATMACAARRRSARASRCSCCFTSRYSLSMWPLTLAHDEAAESRLSIAVPARDALDPSFAARRGRRASGPRRRRRGQLSRRRRPSAARGVELLVARLPTPTPATVSDAPPDTPSSPELESAPDEPAEPSPRNDPFVQPHQHYGAARRPTTSTTRTTTRPSRWRRRRRRRPTRDGRPRASRARWRSASRRRRASSTRRARARGSRTRRAGCTRRSSTRCSARSPARAPLDEPPSPRAAPGEDAVFPPPRPPGVPHVPVVALRVPKRRRG